MERTGTGNGGTRRHADRGTGKSVKVWRVKGVGDSHVGSAFHQDRSLGAVVKR